MMKITGDQAQEIRARRRNGETLMDIAFDYDISHTQVRRICMGESHGVLAVKFGSAMERFFRIYPPVKHEKLEPSRQLMKIRAELMEAESALDEGDLAHMVLEVHDIITACSTLLSRARLAGMDIDGEYKNMIVKNNDRGYYDANA